LADLPGTARLPLGAISALTLYPSLGDLTAMLIKEGAGAGGATQGQCEHAQACGV